MRCVRTYVHVHNTVKPHSRLGVTPFELLVGWKYRGTFPALWDAVSTKVDRDEIREKDAFTKLVSKHHADRHRGAKQSDITAGDKVVIAIPRKVKTDPMFSDERYTVLSRDGAKVVVRSERGVQYSRNVQDVKRAPEYESDPDEDEQYFKRPQEGSYSTVDPFWEATEAARPKRNAKMPERFDDNYVYNGKEQRRQEDAGDQNTQALKDFSSSTEAERFSQVEKSQNREDGSVDNRKDEPGTQLGRSEEDAKRTDQARTETGQSEDDFGRSLDTHQNSGTVEIKREVPTQGNQTGRPKRSIRKPERFKDMFVYHIFE